jgi:hypothetical protein
MSDTQSPGRLKRAEEHIDALLAEVESLPFTGRNEQVRALEGVEAVRHHLRSVALRDEVEAPPAEPVTEHLPDAA